MVRELEEGVMNIYIYMFVFWNVTGIYNKDREFWRSVTDFDFISLYETWVEEAG